jgi:hypothetical protein
MEPEIRGTPVMRSATVPAELADAHRAALWDAWQVRDWKWTGERVWGIAECPTPVQDWE